MLELIAQNENSTVVGEYISQKPKEDGYQSEAELEQSFITQLTSQGYERIKLTNENEILSNLKFQIEKLNGVKFKDREWDRFLNEYIINDNNDLVEKTRLIQEEDTLAFKLDDESLINLKLIDKKNIHNNTLQVTNQFKDEGHKNRYDVTIFVNGLPLVHIELKRRGVALKEAFNQISRYKRTSFKKGARLFEYVQIFVISNGTYTKYYSNTVREDSLSDRVKKGSDTFEFTSFWTDATNKQIRDLYDFSRTFLTRRTLLNVITKYCVFTVDNKLLVMRPYQIVATERILNKILVAKEQKLYATNRSGGYIWHTTGSGKTLTSFKTAILASKLGYISKVLFVVDRKDLDYQTMKEYNKFQKDAVNSSSSAKILKQQLEDDNVNIIVTTIQKLNNFIKTNQKHEIYDKEIVIIFDECHRSQFGLMHKNIKKNFKKHYMFGFTGTPIFTDNIGSNYVTTSDLFGDELHNYTIVNAIHDQNVLPFKVSYLNTIKEKDDIKDKEVAAIDKSGALMSDERIKLNSEYILKHFEAQTKNKSGYVFNTPQIPSPNGFNSMLATSNIQMAKKYYDAFKSFKHNLKIATIFSFTPNEDEDESSESTEGLDATSREFLDSAINDYNLMFATSYDTSANKFENYYKDISLRMKNKELDLLIVVGMFLTGFEAKCLNTLWVDKNMIYHGLIQAFSRTNRILNSVKQFGNIVCFRNLEADLNNALTLFGNANKARGVVLLKTYDDYYYGYDKDGESFVGYETLVKELKDKYPIGEDIVGESNKKEFIRLYSQILRVRNILTCFDKFESDTLLRQRELQDYQSIYIQIYASYRNITKTQAEKEDIIDDVEFEIELIKQVTVDIDFILDLLEKYSKDTSNKEVVVDIEKAMDASLELRDKKELILQFLATINTTTDVRAEFTKFTNLKKNEELNAIIKQEQLDRDKTLKFMRKSYKNGKVDILGTEIVDLMPKMSMFDKKREESKERITIKLVEFFDKFYTISNGEF